MVENLYNNVVTIGLGLITAICGYGAFLLMKISVQNKKTNTLLQNAVDTSFDEEMGDIPQPEPKEEPEPKMTKLEKRKKQKKLEELKDKITQLEGELEDE